MTYDADARWQEIKDMPESQIRRVTFEEIYSRAKSWDLPASCSQIVRVLDKETGRITEKSFSTEGRAHAYANRCFRKGCDITSFDDEAMACSYAVAGMYNGDDEDDDESE
jgi:nitrite reductase/ring-hydroxylating ferredoxin subunit